MGTNYYRTADLDEAGHVGKVSSLAPAAGGPTFFSALCPDDLLEAMTRPVWNEYGDEVSVATFARVVAMRRVDYSLVGRELS